MKKVDPVKGAPRIGLIEDDDIFREELIGKLLTFIPEEAVRIWISAEDYLNDKGSIELDLLFLDIRLPGMGGLELLSIIGKRGLSFPVIVLSSINSEETIFRALKAGATGYIHKSELQDLETTVTATLDGGAIISPTIALKVLHSFKKPSVNNEYDDLTPREKEVLNLLVEGLTTQEAAETLFISVHTLRIHVKNIYRKLFVRNKTELLRKAGKLGLF